MAISDDANDAGPGDVTRLTAPPRARRARRVAAVTLLLAVGIACGWAGWALKAHTSERPSIVVRRTVTVVSDAPSHDGTAPSVVGLRLDEARQAFADAGVPPERIATATRPSVQPPGTVIAQSPAPAAAISKGGGRLTTAVPAQMPSLVGKSEQAARDSLESLGATATIVARTSQGSPDGAVLSTRPAAGSLLGPDATVTVAAPSSAVNLADLELSHPECPSGDATVSGKGHSNALVCSTEATTPSIIGLDVAGHARGLSFVIAMTDGTSPTARARYRVMVDGRPRTRGVLTPNTAPSIRLGITGARHVSIEVRGNDDDPSVAVLDGRLVGSRAGIDAISTAQP